MPFLPILHFFLMKLFFFPIISNLPFLCCSQFSFLHVKHILTRASVFLRGSSLQSSCPFSFPGRGLLVSNICHNLLATAFHYFTHLELSSTNLLSTFVRHCGQALRITDDCWSLTIAMGWGEQTCKYTSAEIEILFLIMGEEGVEWVHFAHKANIYDYF